MKKTQLPPFNPLRFSSFSLLLVVSLVSCQDPNEKTPPTVNIVQPASDANITGTVPIQIDALDAVGISSVKVKLKPVVQTRGGFVLN